MSVVALTDAYLAMSAGDPLREVVCATWNAKIDRATSLLKRLLWQLEDTAEATSAEAPVLVLA